MGELLKALKEVEALEKKNNDLYEKTQKLERENFLIREDLYKHYPFFMFVRVEHKKRFRGLRYRHSNNYFNESPISLADLKNRMFNDVHDFLRDLEKELEGGE